MSEIYSLEECLNITTRMYNYFLPVYGKKQLGRNPVLVMIEMLSYLTDSSKGKKIFTEAFLKISNGVVFTEPRVFHTKFADIVKVCLLNDHLLTHDEASKMKLVLSGN